MRLTRLPIALLAIASLALVVACGGSDQASTATRTAEGADLASAAVASEVEVRMRDLAFEPARVTVRSGEVVEMMFRNGGELLHDFTIDKVDADVLPMMGGTGPGTDAHSAAGGHGPSAAMHMALDAGQEGRMRIRVHEPGEYTFYCTVAGHREAGMTGTLVVQ